MIWYVVSNGTPDNQGIWWSNGGLMCETHEQMAFLFLHRFCHLRWGFKWANRWIPQFMAGLWHFGSGESWGFQMDGMEVSIFDTGC